VSDPLRLMPGPGETVLMTVRHGLTELNRDKRVGGRIDVPLIDEGRAQAREAAQRFAGMPLDIVVTSPLTRSIETAELVTGWSRDRLEVDEGCIERSFGEMEGMDPAEVPVCFPHVRYLRIGHIGYSLNPPGGESFDALHDRAHRFLHGVLKRHEGTNVAVFSHQNFLQQLHAVIRVQDAYRALETDILNCELNGFRLGPGAGLLEEATVQLVPSAGDHASF